MDHHRRPNAVVAASFVIIRPVPNHPPILPTVDTRIIRIVRIIRTGFRLVGIHVGPPFALDVFLEQGSANLELANGPLSIGNAREDPEDEVPLRAPRHRAWRPCAAVLIERRALSSQRVHHAKVLRPVQPFHPGVRHRRLALRPASRFLCDFPQLLHQPELGVRLVQPVVGSHVVLVAAVDELGGRDERPERDEFVVGAALARVDQPLDVLKRELGAAPVRSRESRLEARELLDRKPRLDVRSHPPEQTS